MKVLLAHPGGPFWKNKDLGAWSIPKGEFSDNENPLDAAIREFEEEIGTKLRGNFIQLESIKLKSGKTVYAFALERDLDVTSVKSNEFEIEWPPKTGKKINIPEIDKAEWFGVKKALEKINAGQADFIVQLARKIQHSH